MQTLPPTTRGLSHTAARFACDALRPHFSTVDGRRHTLGALDSYL